MVYLAILNLIGIIDCIVKKSILLYVVSYIVAISFFNSYSKVVWKYLYEPFVGTAADAELVDTRLMNIVSIVIIITSIFYFICFEFQELCLSVSILQCIAFQMVKLYKERTRINVIMLIVLLAEFLIAFSIR